MERRWTSWDTWEDYKSNFYGSVTGDWQRDNTLELYASLLRDLPKFEAALQHIVEKWPNSLLHNLTDAGRNRRAYMGQAACALLYRVPHKVSMSGYQLLTQAEKDAADAMAWKYIEIFLRKHGIEDIGE